MIKNLLSKLVIFGLSLFVDVHWSLILCKTQKKSKMYIVQLLSGTKFLFLPQICLPHSQLNLISRYNDCNRNIFWIKARLYEIMCRSLQQTCRTGWLLQSFCRLNFSTLISFTKSCDNFDDIRFRHYSIEFLTFRFVSTCHFSFPSILQASNCF